MAGMSLSGGGSSTLTLSGGDASLAEQENQSGLLEDILSRQNDGTQKTQVIDSDGITTLDIVSGAAKVTTTQLPDSLGAKADASSLSVVFGESTDPRNSARAWYQKIVGGVSGEVADVTADKQLRTQIDTVGGKVDAANSTTSILGIGGNFTGTWVETLKYTAIQVGIESDQNSSTNGFRVEFSNDGTNVSHYHDYTYQAGDGVGYLFQPEFKYYRVNYTNGAVAQTKFIVSSVLKPVSLFPSQYRVDKAITGQSQAIVTKGVIYGLSSQGGGAYHAVKVTPSGAMATEVQGTYNSTPISLNNGDEAPLQLDSNGYLKAAITNASLAVTGPLTDAQLRATAVPVTGPLTDTQLRATAVPVSLASAPAVTGRAKVGQLFNDYTSSSVTTSAYVQLTASTAATVNKIEIFDSTGEALILAVGGAGSEVDQLYIFPGGNGPVDLAIPASSRISVKAKTATASVGFLAINLYS